MRKTVDKPYEEDKWSYYGVLHHRAEGKTFPLTYENANGENVILTGGHSEDGTKFYTVKTLQNNGWINVSTYYEDGTFEETFEK